MRKTTSTHWWMMAAVCCCIMLLSAAPSSVAESDATNATPTVDNVGFMKNPPQELVDRFPMCDEFLDVTWIDKEKRIGISVYDLYDSSGNKKVQSVMRLVHIDSMLPRYNYSTEEYYPNSASDSLQTTDFKYSEIQALYSFIKAGEIEKMNLNLRIVHDGQSIEFYPAFQDLTLANYERNVCIPYPDNLRMWLAEIKKVRNIYSISVQQQIKQLLGKLRRGSNSGKNVDVSGLGVLDVNFDQSEDYISGNTIFYSVADSYFSANQRVSDGLLHWTFPPFSGQCNVKSIGPIFITTNGNDYFFFNECNLSLLTRGD